MVKASLTERYTTISFRHRERGDKIDPQAETANFYARLDHERFLARQTLITASTTAAWLAPAQC